MERKFYPENFERFLKGHADQFKMTPSKKVWHGIYNDLHPGRRWPSIAMSLVFVFTLVIIGHLNTNNGNNNTLHNLASLQNADLKKPGKTKTTLRQIKQRETKSNDIAAANTPTEVIDDINDPANATPLLSVLKNAELSSNTQTTSSNITQVKPGNVGENKNEVLASEKIVNVVDKSSLDAAQENAKEKNSNNEVVVNIPTDNQEIEIISPEKEKDTEAAINLPIETTTANIKKPRKANSPSWMLYVSPSLGYRVLSDREVNNAVTHKTMMGYEGGVTMGLKLYKKLQFTTGLQFNFSGYNIQATNTHPIIASIVLNGELLGQPELYSTISHYGNRTGTEYTKLKNYSLQASLPIGLQYTFAGNENVKFNLAASIQPTYILLSKAYFLSEDKKNYLTTPDLFRKWNTNTSFGAYVSFSSNSFNWQIGPQIRYQLLSTYSNRYQLKEHLINYGIRIGISNLSK